MKIRTKIFLIFLSISFILTIASMVALLVFSDNLLREAIKSRLEMAVQSKSVHMNGFSNQQKQKNIILSKDHHWSDLLRQLYGQKSPQGFFGEEFYIHSEDELKNKIQREYYQLFVLDKDGDIILSTKKEWVGNSRSDSDYFLNSKEEIFISDVFYVEEDDKFVYAISSPLLEDANGEYLGSLVSLIDMQRLFDVIGQGLGLGETGEVYLVNRDGYMITPSKFIENSVLTQKIDNVNLKNCFDTADLESEEADILHKVEHELRVYPDYRGYNVLGPQECDAFCRNPENLEECIKFAGEHGMLEGEKMEMMMDRSQDAMMRMEEIERQKEFYMERSPEDGFRTPFFDDRDPRMMDGFNIPEECKRAGALSPEACEKHMRDISSFDNRDFGDVQFEVPEECKKVGALSPEACERHMRETQSMGSGCGDCQAQCSGSSYTECINNRCVCGFE
ncbi:cache domain-containing protein, partial [Patescibacteria group bacterium]